MKTRFRSEADEWKPDGAKITSDENLARLRQVLEDEGPIIVEHWFYGGESPAARFIFDDFDAFTEYLDEYAFAGDVIHVWSFSAVCDDNSRLASGKCPDENGLVPQGGEY